MLFARPEYLGFLVAFAVGSALPGTLSAQTPPCSAEEYRQCDPAHIRQFWETTLDGGMTWTVTFDGHYLREN